MLDRLLAALHRNPHLEFQVWAAMRQIGFYGPWKSEGADSVLEDMDGKIVASIQEEDVFEWEAGSHSGTCSNLAEAQQQVESALASEGWRRIPDEGVQGGALVAHWVEKEPNGERSSGYWERVRRGLPLARVFFENGKWRGAVFCTDLDTLRYECEADRNSCEYAKHGVDTILYENGLIERSDISPEDMGIYR